MTSNNHLSQGFQGVVSGVVKAMWIFSILLLVVVIPVFLFHTWTHPATLVESILDTVLTFSCAWAVVSAALCLRTLRRLGFDGQAGLRLFSGPRPSDLSQLRAWRQGWHFMFAILAGLLCIITVPVASWLSGK